MERKNHVIRHFYLIHMNLKSCRFQRRVRIREEKEDNEGKEDGKEKE